MTRVQPRNPERLPGLYRAEVVAAVDPQGMQRVQVNVPSVPGAAAVWALTLATLGPRPEVGDTVLVGFEEGFPDKPVAVGVLATAAATSVEIRDESGNRIRIAPSGIEVTAGSLRVNTPMSQFSGVVKTPTLIADSVIAASYTPGAGNVL